MDHPYGDSGGCDCGSGGCNNALCAAVETAVVPAENDATVETAVLHAEKDSKIKRLRDESNKTVFPALKKTARKIEEGTSNCVLLNIDILYNRAAPSRYVELCTPGRPGRRTPSVSS